VAIILELVNREHVHVLMQECNKRHIKVKNRDKQEPEERLRTTHTHTHTHTHKR